MQLDDSLILSPKVVLVTGGAGFIGSHVADRLIGRGDTVVIVDEINDYYDVRLKEANLRYLSEKYSEAKVKIYRGDICNAEFISDLFQKEKPTHICHLAARAGVRASIVDPYIYVHSNIEGTTRLLDLARQYACANFVYASSSSVYGCSEKSVLSESDAVEKPVSPYAATKKACELLAYTFHHLYGLNCTGLRFFTVYGPRGRPDMAPFKFIDRVFNGHAIQQYGDGSTSRDYTYIDDIVAGVVAAIDTPIGCEVVNLGNGKPYLLKDFIALVESCVGRKAIIEVLPEQPGDVERTCADISKARKLFGYSPQVSFHEGIARTAAWYKQAQSEGFFNHLHATNTTVLSASPNADSSDGNSDLLASSSSSSSIDEQDHTNSNKDDDTTQIMTVPVVSVGLDLSGSDEEKEEVADKEKAANAQQTKQKTSVSSTLVGPAPANPITRRSRSVDYSLPVKKRRHHHHHHHEHNDDHLHHEKRRRLLARIESDLELSSYVEKADRQYKVRTERILHVNTFPSVHGEKHSVNDTSINSINNNNNNKNDNNGNINQINNEENNSSLPRSLSV